MKQYPVMTQWWWWWWFRSLGFPPLLSPQQGSPGRHHTLHWWRQWTCPMSPCWPSLEVSSPGCCPHPQRISPPLPLSASGLTSRLTSSPASPPHYRSSSSRHPRTPGRSTRTTSPRSPDSGKWSESRCRSRSRQKTGFWFEGWRISRWKAGWHRRRRKR